MSESGSVTVAMTGDVMLGRLVNEAIRQNGPAWPWGDFRSELAGADLTIVNLECVIAQDGQPWQRWPKVFHFRADPIAIHSLLVAGVDAIGLANNHTLDFDVEGLLEMLRLLDDHGIAHAGAGRDLAEAERPAVVQAKGLRVALLSFTDNEPGWMAGESTPGTNYAPVSLDTLSFVRIEAAIDRARRDADLIFFSNHWGPNMRERPPREFREFAHAVLDAGADVYIGHSAHIFQGIEVYKGKPLVYDAGDFVDDYAVDRALRNDQALLFLLKVGSRGVEELELVPALIEDFRVSRARGKDFDVIAARIRRLSTELGTHVTVSGDRLVVSLKDPARARHPAA